MTIELYCFPLSIPSRAVFLAAKALDVTLELKTVDLMAGENRTEEYMKMNPQHTVPFMVDGDLAISESCAIIIYLADTYGKDDSLYPQDLKKRALINQRMFFSVGTLVNRLAAAYIVPVMFLGMPVNDDMVPLVDDAFNTLNTYLDGNDWVAGEAISIADYAIISTVSTAEAIGYDIEKHANVASWLARCKEVMEDYDTLNQNGVDQFATVFAEKLSQM